MALQYVRQLPKYDGGMDGSIPVDSESTGTGRLTLEELKEKFGLPDDVDRRLSFLENNMLQTKPEANNPNSGILKLFRGPLPWSPGGHNP